MELPLRHMQTAGLQKLQHDGAVPGGAGRTNPVHARIHRIHGDSVLRVVGWRGLAGVYRVNDCPGRVAFRERLWLRLRLRLRLQLRLQLRLRVRMRFRVHLRLQARSIWCQLRSRKHSCGSHPTYPIDGSSLKRRLDCVDVWVLGMR